jgi:hypothetical protein
MFSASFFGGGDLQEAGGAEGDGEDDGDDPQGDVHEVSWVNLRCQ